MAAFEKGERNERGDHLIEFAGEHKLIIANTLCQKQKKKKKKKKKKIFELGVTRWGNNKPNRLCTE